MRGGVEQRTLAEIEIDGFLKGNPAVREMVIKNASADEPNARHRARCLLFGHDTSHAFGWDRSEHNRASNPEIFEDRLRNEFTMLPGTVKFGSLDNLPTITFEELFRRKRFLERPAVNNIWNAEDWEALRDCEDLLPWLWVTVTRLDKLLFSPRSWGSTTTSSLVESKGSYGVSALERGIASMIIAINSGLITVPLPTWHERVMFFSSVGANIPVLSSNTGIGGRLMWAALAKVLGLTELPRGTAAKLIEVPIGAIKQHPKLGAWLVGRALMPFPAGLNTNGEEADEWIAGVAENIRTTSIGQDLLRWRRAKKDQFLRWALDDAWYGKHISEHPEWRLELHQLGIVSEYQYFEAICCDIPGEERAKSPSLAEAEEARLKLLRRRANDERKRSLRS